MKARRTVGRVLLAATLALGAGPVVASAAFAGGGNSHAEQADGCDHGNSGKPCKDDPQPDKGKDCQTHGNWGGINEDHCADTGDTGTGSG